MKDLRKIPPDSEFWTNPPLPKADNNHGGWLSWCQRLSEDVYRRKTKAVMVEEDTEQKHESVRRGAKNDGTMELKRD